jgi:predicted HTH transcriptional regulator
MKDLFLEEPLYSEPEQYVKLVLKNNIAIRSVRVTEKMQNNIGTDIWNSLDDTTKEILAYMSSRQCVSRPELERYTGKSSGTVTNRLKRLIELNLIKRNGLQYDPNQTYSIDVK